jgi:FKBP-type peptidyl-prolyl cis-trans isomerase
MFSIPLQRSSIFALAVFLLSTAVNFGAVSAVTNEAGIAFLKENKDKPGVISLPPVLHFSRFGLQYKVLKSGEGLVNPLVDADVKVFYEGRLLDGTIFNSLLDGEPAVLQPKDFLLGWTRALQQMVVGDKWELYIPCEEAFGDKGSPPDGIPEGDVVIFTLELVDIFDHDGTKTVLAMKCSIDSKAEEDDKCNEKEREYIAKVQTWYDEDDDLKLTSEFERIRTMTTKGDLSGDLQEWARRRHNILKQFNTKMEKKLAEAEEKAEAEL